MWANLKEANRKVGHPLVMGLGELVQIARSIRFALMLTAAQGHRAYRAAVGCLGSPKRQDSGALVMGAKALKTPLTILKCPKARNNRSRCRLNKRPTKRRDINKLTMAPTKKPVC